MGVLEWKGLKPGDLKDNVHANIFIDVFGLGQTLFELACGRHLYDAIRKSKTLTAVFSGGFNSLTPENKFNACYVCKDENYQEKHCSNERRFFVDFVDHFMISEYDKDYDGMTRTPTPARWDPDFLYSKLENWPSKEEQNTATIDQWREEYRKQIETKACQK